MFRSKVMNSNAPVFFSLAESRFQRSLKFWHLMRSFTLLTGNYSAKHCSTQASAVALSYLLRKRANYLQGPCTIFTCNLMNFVVASLISATLLVPRGHKTKSSQRLSLGFHFCRTACSRARNSCRLRLIEAESQLLRTGVPLIEFLGDLH